MQQPDATEVEIDKEIDTMIQHLALLCDLPKDQIMTKLVTDELRAQGYIQAD